MLIEGADVPIRMGTTVTHLERSPDALVVTLSDQTTATYRLVVGAEGVYSTVRALVASVEPRYVGQMYWRGILDRPCGVEDITAWVARSQFFGVTPVGGGRTRWFAQIATENPLDIKEGTGERLATLFAGFCEPLPTILGLIAAGGQFHFGPAASVDCPRWFDRRVLVVGDAAHALSPVSGQGAAMAFEDAVVLAEELGSATSVDDAPSAFESRRRPRIEALRRLVANRVARATGRTAARTPDPVSFDPWFDQSSLLSTPP